MDIITAIMNSFFINAINESFKVQAADQSASYFSTSLFFFFFFDLMVHPSFYNSSNYYTYDQFKKFTRSDFLRSIY